MQYTYYIYIYNKFKDFWKFTYIFLMNHINIYIYISIYMRLYTYIYSLCKPPLFKGLRIAVNFLNILNN